MPHPCETRGPSKRSLLGWEARVGYHNPSQREGLLSSCALRCDAEKQTSAFSTSGSYLRIPCDLFRSIQPPPPSAIRGNGVLEGVRKSLPKLRAITPASCALLKHHRLALPLLFSYTVLHASASHSEILRGVLQGMRPRHLFRHKRIPFQRHLRSLPHLRGETKVSADGCITRKATPELLAEEAEDGQEAI